MNHGSQLILEYESKIYPFFNLKMIPVFIDVFMFNVLYQGWTFTLSFGPSKSEEIILSKYEKMKSFFYIYYEVFFIYINKIYNPHDSFHGLYYIPIFNLVDVRSHVWYIFLYIFLYLLIDIIVSR